MTEWQPIATAPKDRSWFIACDGHGGDVYPAHAREWPRAVCRSGLGWCHASGLMKYPTHWMPLPKGPH